MPCLLVFGRGTDVNFPGTYLNQTSMPIFSFSTLFSFLGKSLYHTCRCSRKGVATEENPQTLLVSLLLMANSSLQATSSSCLRGEGTYGLISNRGLRFIKLDDPLYDHKISVKVFGATSPIEAFSRCPCRGRNRPFVAVGTIICENVPLVLTFFQAGVLLRPQEDLSYPRAGQRRRAVQVFGGRRLLQASECMPNKHKLRTDART